MARAQQLTALQRRCAEQVGWPSPDVGSRGCRCGAAYLDYDGGHDAHEVVFGHRPVARAVEGNDAEETQT